MNGYALENPLYLPDWAGYSDNRWFDVDLVTDLIVAREAVNHVAHYESMLSLYESENSDAIVGTYISGADCRAKNQMDSYPHETITYNSMPPNFMGPYDFSQRLARVKIEIPEARRIFADKIFDTITSRRRPLVYLDNIRHTTRWNPPFEWPEYWRVTCGFLRSLTDRFHCSNIRTIANIAGLPLYMTAPEQIPEDANLIQEAVDGFSFEESFVFRPNEPNPLGVIERGIGVYRQWLNADKTVVLIPVLPLPRPPLENTAAVSKQFTAYHAALAMIIRDRGHRLFVASSYQIPPEELIWNDWPARLGYPRGNYTSSSLGGQTILMRRFVNGRVKVGVNVNGRLPYAYSVEL